MANVETAKLALVLLPGMDGTGELFAPFLAALGHGVEVGVVRYPTAEPLDYNELESVARAMLPEGPCVLLGESFSGPIAILLAASGLPRIKGLILCGSFARNPRPLFTSLRWLVGALPLKAVPVGMLGWLLLGKFSTPALRAALAQALAQVSLAALRARFRAVLSIDVCARLRATTVPTLYLRATHDRAVPGAASRLVSQLKPNTRVVQVDAPHCLLQVAPAEAARIVLEFMRQIQSTVRPASCPVEPPLDEHRR